MKWITAVQLLVSFFLLCVLFRRGFCCADSWLRHDEHCFRIYTKPLTMLMASAECFLQGSDLISITDESLFQFLSVQLQHLPGDRFWIDLQYDDEVRKLSSMDGTNTTKKPWVKPHIPEVLSLSTSADTDCFAFNGTLIVKNPCSENLGYICGHKSTTRTVCNQNVDPEHSFIGTATGNCLFRAPEKTKKNKVEELCAEYQGSFVDLDVMMKDGLSAFNDHKVFVNDGSKYWTSLTWNGTNIIWNDTLSDYFSIVIINGTGSCITAQFNFTDILETHLYLTDCDSEVQVVCSKTAEPTENLVATRTTVNDEGMLSCPHGISWVENSNSGYCYWETAFDTERLPWDDAESYCQSFGGHLSSFHSLEEEKVGLGIQYGVLAQPYWIGLKLDPETETYKWSDGTLLNYTNWAPGHPDHEDKHLPCVAMEAKEKHWVSSLCGIHSWVICKVPKQSNPPKPGLPTPIPLQPCDSLVQVDQRIVSYFFEESCYFTVSESYNWHKAKQFCENEGATLVSIHSVGEVGFLLKLLHESVLESNSVWIGLNSLESDESFRWTDRSPLDFIYFNKDEPNNFYNQEKCCNMYTGNGLWNDENCNAEMSFICKRKNDTSGTTVISISTPDPRIGNCKKGWISHHDRCYYLGGKEEKDRVNWTQAVDKCLAQGGYLTSVRDEKDQGFLSFLLQSLGVDAWIGLHDTIETGKYYWMDNLEMQYTRWALFETSPSIIKKDCVKMMYDTTDSGVWKDEECERKMGYICYSRKDPNLPAPSNDQGISCVQPEGWLRLGSMCFKMFGGNNLTWKEAETSCRMDGAHLVSVSDKGVKAVLSYLAAEVKMPFWIGLQYKESTQTVSWLNGWPVTLTSWDKNEPGFMKDDVCIASTFDGYWKKSRCTEKMSYVCQITEGKPTKQKEYTGQCPSAAKHWTPADGSNCYILERDFLNHWFTAKRVCSRYGSQLASIHSQEEINSLKKLMKSGITSVFIGLIRTNNGGFSWIDDTPVNFMNWDKDQPKNNDDGCVEMMADTMKWRVTNCLAKKHFVCQTAKEHSSQPPTHGQLKNELSTSTLTAIIIGTMIALLLIVAVAVYLRKKSAGKKFHIFSNDQFRSFDNVLYDVKAAEMESQN